MLLFLLFIFTVNSVNAQDTYLGDTIVDLDEVLVKARRKLSILKPPKGKTISMGVKSGESSIVSKVQVEKGKKYSIQALEFFFNRRKSDIKENEFYIKPLLLKSFQGEPSDYYLEGKKAYRVSKKVRETIYIDLSSYNIQIENTDAFFVGLELFGEDGAFNVTMLKLKNQTETSFVTCPYPYCVFSPFYLPDAGLTLKYNIYYK